jgi:heterodisulfide reductase subunit C
MNEPLQEAREGARTVEESSLDPTLADEVAQEPGGEGIRKCFACGTCTAGCPVRRFNERFNPRRIIRMVLLGMREEVLGEPFVWLCATCFTCQERCPQGVRISDLMRALKNLALRRGNMPEGIPIQARLLAEKGTLYPLDEFDNKKRVKAGLPALPEGHGEVGPLLRELEEILSQKESGSKSE